MWIEIFRAGKHMSSNGITKEYTPEDILLIEKKYNEKTEKDSSFDAPLVKGHPKDNEPAYGWVEKLARKGEKIFAKIKNPEKSIVDDVNKGRFKKVSVALYPDMMLRHVGLLGAASPAVKGLRPVTFDDKSEYLEFSVDKQDFPEKEDVYFSELEKAKMENYDLKQQIKEFDKQTRMMKFEEFTNELINANKFISPAQCGLLKNIFEEIHNYSGEKSEVIINNIKEFVREYDGQDLTSSLNSGDFHSSKNEIHSKALKIRKDNPDLTYEEAVLKAHSFFYK